MTVAGFSRKNKLINGTFAIFQGRGTKGKGPAVAVTRLLGRPDAMRPVLPQQDVPCRKAVPLLAGEKPNGALRDVARRR